MSPKTVFYLLAFLYQTQSEPSHSGAGAHVGMNRLNPNRTTALENSLLAGDIHAFGICLLMYVYMPFGIFDLYMYANHASCWAIPMNLDFRPLIPGLSTRPAASKG